MPKLAVYKFLTFFIVAYDLSERLHVHVNKSKGYKTRSAKIWLDTLDVFEEGDLTKKELNTAIEILKQHKQEFTEQINKFAKGEKISTLHLD